MTVEDNDFLSDYGKFYSPIHPKKNVIFPFRQHGQFAILVDILSRKECHHVILTADYSPRFRQAFLQSFLQHLSSENSVQALHNIDLLDLELENLILNKTNQKKFAKDFNALLDKLNKSEKYILFSLPDLYFLIPSKKGNNEFWRNQLLPLLKHPNSRFLVFADLQEYQGNSALKHFFTEVSLAKPTEENILALLKQQRLELEKFHHIVIPEDLLMQAYLLAERFLSNTDILEQCLYLLDSSAARASTIENDDNQKPILTASLLLSVLSSWTEIPSSYLQLNQFNPNEFSQGMHQRVFGQDAAIMVMAQELQHTQLHHKTKPFCCFLFVGPKHAGKTSMALGFVEQLFNQVNALYFIQSAANLQSLVEIKVQRYVDGEYFFLKDVIKKMPYAVFMFKNIELSAHSFLNDLHELLSTGYLRNTEGDILNFRQASILLSTTLGTESIVELASSRTHDELPTIDLMQLVMRDQKQPGYAVSPHYSPNELINIIGAEIKAHFPNLYSCVPIVPFLPLGRSSIEKIIRLKLKMLSKQLELRYEIELGYAPEVIYYLVNQALATDDNKNMIPDTDKATKQLYISVEQAILHQLDNKNRPNQLFLQLNETGRLLRCDWSLTPTAVRQHTL